MTTEREAALAVYRAASAAARRRSHEAQARASQVQRECLCEEARAWVEYCRTMGYEMVPFDDRDLW